MIKLNDLETFLRIYHVKQVSEKKWKFGPFEIVFLDNTVVIYGKFLYSLSKEICSMPCYLNSLFLSEGKEILPFEYYLTSPFLEKQLSITSNLLTYGAYEEYCSIYDEYRIEFIKKFIADGNYSELFLEQMFITDISTLHDVILSIRNFYSEIPSKTSIST